MRPAVVLAALGVAVAFAATASRASTPPRIVFAANRAPTVTGEIYRLDPNGRRVDLSRSPAYDTGPAVSSDGKVVAFISDRGGALGVYEVEIGGGAVVPIARRVRFLDKFNSRLAWEPNGAQLAVDTDKAVSVFQRGYKPITFTKTTFGASQPWSPDGQVLLLHQGFNTVRAVSPQGFTLWTGRESSYPVGGWSSQGLLAAATGHDVVVYDEVGRLRFTSNLSNGAEAIAWSRDGSRLAVEWGIDHTNLAVWSADGTQLLSKRLSAAGSLGWNGDKKVVVGIPWCSSCQTISVDVGTGNTAPASSRWLEQSSADGKLALDAQAKAPGFVLGATPLPSGATRTYGEVAGCFEDASWSPAVSSQQFAGHAIVYESWNATCDAPFDNLYAARGTRIHRLTTVTAEEKQPALSPDGTQIAYVWASALGMSCKGCSDGIRIASADGTAIRTLTNPPDCTFDDSPSWSPDGTTIVYSETGCDNPGELFTIPAAGGTPHDLGVAGTSPAWGPSKIAYQSALDQPPGLWTANPDGTGAVKISTHGVSPAWSPSGELAYRLGTTLVVGTTHTKLPFKQLNLLGWAPDGTRLVIAASTERHGSLDLYTVAPDGTGLTRLTKNYGVS